MNKARRKQLEKIYDTLIDAKSDLELLRDEEQEYYDNMPESLQGSEKGTNAEEAVSEIEEAMDNIDSALTNIENAKNK